LTADDVADRVIAAANTFMLCATDGTWVERGHIVDDELNAAKLALTQFRCRSADDITVLMTAFWSLWEWGNDLELGLPDYFQAEVNAVRIRRSKNEFWQGADI
jgi:hypothetical protein